MTVTKKVLNNASATMTFLESVSVRSAAEERSKRLWDLANKVLEIKKRRYERRDEINGQNFLDFGPSCNRRSFFSRLES